MSNGSVSTSILNPDVYLNYLPATLAAEYEMSRNVYFMTLGTLVWDICSSLPEDYSFISTGGISIVLSAYFSARLFSLALTIVSTLGRTGSAPDCAIIAWGMAIFWFLASTSSSYLFLARVRAIFWQSTKVRYTFTFLWIVNVSAACLVIPGKPAYNEIADTKHCLLSKYKPYVTIAFVAPVIFDTLVFLCITYKILRMETVPTPGSKKRGWRWRWSATMLPRIPRAILYGQQQYYLLATTFNIARCILLFVPPNSRTYQVVPSVPVAALISMLACHVFRRLRSETSVLEENSTITLNEV